MAEQLPFASGATPVVLVVLASEQLWPNLESICLYRRSLRRLIILHTRDAHRSVRPANALVAIARDLFNVPSERIRVGTQPRDVTAAVQKVLDRFKNGPKCVVLNATCGTKLMTAGILRWVDAPGTVTIYREIEGHWYRLRRDRDGRSIVTNRLVTEKNPTDLVDIRMLLRAAWGPAAELHAADLPDLPVDRIAAALVEFARFDKGAWKRAFKHAAAEHLNKRDRPSDPGGLFETFVAGCIRKLGVTNGVLNAEVRRGGKSLQEFDVVVNTAGRIVVVDCKTGRPQGDLRRVEEEAMQFRRQVGGLGAGCAVIRPDKRTSAQLRSVCDLHDITLVCKEDIGQLCRILAKCLGVRKLPPEVIATDRYLSQWNERRG